MGMGVGVGWDGGMGGMEKGCRGGMGVGVGWRRG